MIAWRSPLPHFRDCRKEIIGAGDEKRVLGKRARRYQPHHVAPHHRLWPAALRRLGVFELLGDRDAEALANELLQIFVRPRHRHAAHRDVLALVTPALGELDTKRSRRLHGIVEEQLEKIAHAVEEQEIRVLGLHTEILRHHGRGVLRLRCLAPAFLPL